MIEVLLIIFLLFCCISSLFLIIADADFFGVASLVLSFIFLSIVLWNNGYKAGQVDILTGHKPLYELKTDSDSTKSWERVK